MSDSLEVLEATLGYRFTDKQLLDQALRHSSFGAESASKNNETFEFLGDAVLDLALSELMMREHPEYNEGDLTRLRAALANASHLADVARELNLGQWLRLGRGEEQSGGRDKESILAAGYEAILGAIFLDAGYEATRAVVAQHFEESVRTPSNAREDFKTTLQEYTQRTHKVTPTYKVTNITGPDHDRRYEVALHLGDNPIAEGNGRSRKHAEQEAAKIGLALLQDNKT